MQRIMKKDLEQAITVINNDLGLSPGDEGEILLDCSYGNYRPMRRTGAGRCDLGWRGGGQETYRYLQGFSEALEHLGRLDKRYHARLEA